MNTEVLKRWIDSLKEFNKKSQVLQLRFPMKMESSSGDMFSPTGLLCDMHAKEVGADWDAARASDVVVYEEQPAKGKKKKTTTKKSTGEKKLKDHLSYMGKADFPPEAVTDWIGVNPSKLCQVHKINSDKAFEGVILFLEKVLAEGDFPSAI